MPDSSRRRIREAVVQFLYAVGPTEELPETPNPAVLSLLLESAREKSTRARARAVVHLQQGRDRIRDGLSPLLRELARIEPGDEEGELGEALRAWSSGEEVLCEHLDKLRHELKGNKDAQRLSEGMEATRLANRSCLRAAAKIVESKPHFPAFQQLHQDALSLHEILIPLGERLSCALGKDLASLPELTSVARAEEALSSASGRIESYYRALRHHLHSIDERLATVLENYAPDRLNRVDRAILRLGTFELLFDDKVPPAVAINEAIELARDFGTTESPGFVNAILDKLAKAPL